MWFPGDSSSGGGSNTVESTLKNGSKVAVSVSGETTDEWFKPRKAFEVKSFSFSVKSSSDLRSEQAQFGGFTIEKIVDTASVGLYKACSLGARFHTAMFAIREAGGDNLLYLQYMFRDVAVTDITWKGGSGNERPTEDVTFEFTAMGFQYVQQNSVGRMANTYRWSWNTVTDKPSLVIPDLCDPPEYLSPVQTVPAEASPISTPATKKR